MAFPGCPDDTFLIDPPVVRHLFKYLSLLLVLFSASLKAEETPSWAVINAADKLMGENVLLRPGRDAYTMHQGGRMVQFQLPRKGYKRDGAAWNVEFMTSRWRQTQGDKTWLAWQETGSDRIAHLIGSIRVEVLPSGVKASWLNQTNLIGSSAPTESEVNLRMGWSSMASSGARGTEPKRDIVVNEFGSAPAAPPRRAPSPDGGIYRQKADGSVEKIDVHGNTVKSPSAPKEAEAPKMGVAPAEPSSKRWLDVLVTRGILVAAVVAVLVFLINPFLPKRGSGSRPAVRS